MAKFKRILVTCKLDESDERVLEHAAALAELKDAELHFLHVVRKNSAEPGDAVFREARAALERALPPEQVIELDVRWEVREGDVVAEVNRYIADQQIDLLVTGSHAHTGLASVFSRNLSAEMIRRQLCPAFVVPLSNVQQPTDEVHDADEEKQQKPPTISIANTPALDLLQRAIRLRATDLHIDPSGSDVDDYVVRMRVDGRLRRYCHLEYDLAKHHIQQYKVLAGIQIAEPFAPHEGSLRVPGEDSDWYVRVTSSPVAGGESVCLRIQSRTAIVRPLSELGLLAESNTALDQVLSRGEGLVLVTGPTGSGKTTSVYSMLKALGSEQHLRNIVTIEDPVEFNLPFLRQMSINEAHGLTLAKGLKTMLRMDPDVVFVGEIRDAETALTAMRAASSGKYVFSTLHTRDVASTVTALFDLGVDAHSLAGNLAGIISQRLLRRLCMECRERVATTESDRRLLEANNVEPVEEWYEARGCRHCQSTGYLGRVGVFEVATPDAVILDAIHDGRPERDVRAAIRATGSRNLLTNALLAAVEGVTTLQEANDMSRMF
ncbi:MAG: ATPase, T2SS/T4P/T4SS family [Planctomycetaceae bacterium]